MAAAKILVVDDDAVARELLADALKKDGYDVEAFANGAEAISRGKQGKVDIVLTDIRMGTVDGLTVLREFKQFSPDTSIVLLTSFGSLEGAIEALNKVPSIIWPSRSGKRKSSSSCSARSITAAWFGRTPAFARS